MAKKRRGHVRRQIWCPKCLRETNHSRPMPDENELVPEGSLSLNLGPLGEALNFPWRCSACKNLLPANQVEGGKVIPPEAVEMNEDAIGDRLEGILSTFEPLDDLPSDDDPDVQKLGDIDPETYFPDADWPPPDAWRGN